MNGEIASLPLVDSIDYTPADEFFTVTFTAGAAGQAYVFETDDPALAFF